MDNVVVIAGPTASKTELAIRLAKEVDGEIIWTRASLPIYEYRYSKPTCGEMQGVPHHLLDVVKPDIPSM